MTPIPRMFHRIWIGPDPMPEVFVRYGETWLEHHPGWDMMTWGNNDLPRLDNQAFFEAAATWSEKSDFLRHEILYRWGGVYVDTDFECLANIEHLIEGIDAFAATENGRVVSMGILGAKSCHALFAAAVDALGENPFPRSKNASDNTGPQFITRSWRKRGLIPPVILPPALVYPSPWGGEIPDDYRTRYPHAVAIHHWAHSWKATA